MAACDWERTTNGKEYSSCGKPGFARVENTPSVIHAERALLFSRSLDQVSP